MGKSSYTRFNQFFESRKDYGAFFLRLIIGWRLIDGTQDNVFSWDRMLEFSIFLEQNNFAYPLAAAIVSVYAQFICGVLYIIGLFVRPAAIVMIINFLVALLTIHLGTTFIESFQALIMFFGSIFFLFNGPGKLSLIEWINTSGKSKYRLPQ
jgi:putative oxidoreductase